MNKFVVALAMIALAFFTSLQVSADEMRPGLLEIKERSTGWFDVVWKIPLKNNRPIDVKLVLPESLTILGSPTYQNTPAALIEHSTYQLNGASLDGKMISIEGLPASQTDVLLRIELKNGSVFSTVLRPTAPTFVIPEQGSKLDVAYSYWQMGLTHILEGSDHLLFVFALLLIVVSVGVLVKAITAFTVAHSITLALASLGVMVLPAAPTEAIISLSIVFLAVEIIHKHQGKVGITERYPWVVAFLFGLFHGLGFAGALAEIGLPQHEVPLALLMFNVGVETGQLLFIAVVLSLFAFLRRIPFDLPKNARRVLPYAIGSVAAFWTIERVLAFIPSSV